MDERPTPAGLRPEAPSQLLLIKSLFDRARQAVRLDTPASRLEAVIELDLVVELTLTAVANLVDTHEGDDRSPREWNWKRCWQRSKAALKRARPGVSLPCYPQLWLLREHRNLAQHHGAVPAADELAGLVDPVERFLKSAFGEAFGVPLAGLELASFIRSDSLRLFVTTAIDARKSRPVFAIAAAKHATREIMRAIRAATHTDRPLQGWRELDDLLRPLGHRRIGRHIHELIVEELEHSADRATLADLGIWPRDAREYSRAVADVMSAPIADGSFLARQRRGFELEAQVWQGRVETAFRYVVKLAVAAESVFPEDLGALDMTHALDFLRDSLATDASGQTSESP